MSEGCHDTHTPRAKQKCYLQKSSSGVNSRPKRELTIDIYSSYAENSKPRSSGCDIRNARAILV